MAKVLCVLYDDPVDGYPPAYARDDVPEIAGYPDGQTAPTPDGDRLHARRAARQRVRRAGTATVPRAERPQPRRDLGQGRPGLGVRARARGRRHRHLAAVLAGVPDRRADREGPEPQAGDHRRHRLRPRRPRRRDRPRRHGRRGDLLQQHQRRRARGDDDPRPGAQLHPVAPEGRRRRLEHRRLRGAVLRPRGHAGRHRRRRPHRRRRAAPARSRSTSGCTTPTATGCPRRSSEELGLTFHETTAGAWCRTATS